jgi:UDP-glucose 4-epimerase
MVSLSGNERLTTLVVGGGGFIGSHFVKLASESGGRNVVVLGRSSKPRFSLPADVTYVQGNGTDVQLISGLFSKCDEVVDLAYATVPKTSFDDPVNDVLINLPASVAMLQEATRHKLKCFLLVSSGGTVYGNSEYLPIDEAHPTEPVSPYGISKLALEKYALMYHKVQGVPTIIVRPANPYGPNQLGNLGQGFVGAAMFASMRKRPVSIFGERGTIRDYVYVGDLAEGLLAVLNSGRAGDTYNIGTGIGHDNRIVLEMLSDVVRRTGYEVDVEVLPPRPFDVVANVLSSARLTCVSGWKPKTEFSEGLARTWTWALNESRYA